MIILTCGHEVHDFDHAFNIMHKTTNNEGSKAISYSTMCGPCEDRFRCAGELFDNQEQANAWLQQKRW